MKKISLLLLLLSVAPLASQGTSQAPREAAAIDRLLDAAVEQKQVPMVVVMVADRQGVVYEHASGAGRDAIFAIASMTKPVTSVAVMQLVEAGRVKLDAPASAYVAELADVRVMDGSSLRAPKAPITIRQLLTHTAGFGYEFFNRDLFERVAKKQLASAMGGGDGFLKAPLLFDPGTEWEYGINTDWLGRIIERVSGRSLEAYFQEKIFEPLRMSDTFFNIPAEKRARLVPIYARQPDGALAPQPLPPAEPVEFHSGGGGLYSTAPDYLRFVRALLAGGQLDGARILTAESVAQMGTNQIGDLTIHPLPSLVPQFAVDRAALPGAVDKFGLGFALNSATEGTARGPRTMSWAGIFNTFFWIDREKELGVVFMSQMLPFMAPGSQRLLEDFDRAVYAALAKGRR